MTRDNAPAREGQPTATDVTRMTGNGGADSRSADETTGATGCHA